MYDSAFSAFGIRWTSRSNVALPFKAKAKNPWFNDKCSNARSDFKRTRNTFLKCKSDVNRLIPILRGCVQSFVIFQSLNSILS